MSAAITLGGGEIGAVFQNLILEPEDIQVHFVTRDQLVAGEAFELLGFFSVVAVRGRTRCP